MDLAQLIAALSGSLTYIAIAWTAEQEVRALVSNSGIVAALNQLFPDVDAQFVQRNQHFPNVLQRGVNRYVQAVQRAELNWEWSGDEGAEPQQRDPGALLAGPGRDLLQAVTVDALATGKLGFFPYRDDRGRILVSALTGFLYPVFTPGNSTGVEGVLQVSSALVDSATVYEVRLYGPGNLWVWQNLTDWKTFTSAPPRAYPQPHAADRLPLAFRITGRDAMRQPEGLAATALPAFKDYMKARVMQSFISEMGGFEERVYTSDKVFDLAVENPRHPYLKELKKVGPRNAKILPTGDSYARLAPVDLKEYRAQATEAQQNVERALNVPNTEGSTAAQAGVALQELREAYTETATALCNVEADALTEAMDLAARLPSSPVAAGYRVTLQPRFTQDTSAERTAIREDFKAAMLPESAALSGLQGLGVSYITDDLIEAAKAREEVNNPIIPKTPVGGA